MLGLPKRRECHRLFNTGHTLASTLDRSNVERNERWVGTLEDVLVLDDEVLKLVLLRWRQVRVCSSCIAEVCPRPAPGRVSVRQEE